MSTVSTEARLLVQCARGAMDQSQEAWVRHTVQDGIDWRALRDLALRHGLMSLLVRHLTRICPEEIPGPYRDHFQGLAVANHHRNLLITGELCRILDCFAASKIAVIPIKGPLLALSLYGDLALREFGDVDLLVPRDRITKAMEVLDGMGYHCEPTLKTHHLRAYLKSSCELTFVKPQGRAWVDLHWQVTPRYFGIPLADRYWDRRMRAGRTPNGVHELCPEETLLLLCVHGTKHRWNRLAWVSDVAELLRTYPALDWDGVLADAASLRCRRMLLLGLALASGVLGAPLPGRLAGQIRGDRVVRRLSAAVRGDLLEEPVKPVRSLKAALFHLAVRDRLRDRIRYGLGLAFTTTPGDWAALPLPAPFSFMQGLLRPVRLAYRLGIVGPLRAVH